MSVQVPPRGTRGTSIPHMPAPLTRFMTATMFRIFKNRHFQNANVLLLTTVGAKSGVERETMVVYFDEPDGSMLIVASAGGTATHPGWFFNLAKNPDKVSVRVGDRRFGRGTCRPDSPGCSPRRGRRSAGPDHRPDPALPDQCRG